MITMLLIAPARDYHGGDDANLGGLDRRLVALHLPDDDPVSSGVTDGKRTVVLTHLRSGEVR